MTENGSSTPRLIKKKGHKANLTWELKYLQPNTFYESPSFWPKEDELTKMHLELCCESKQDVRSCIEGYQLSLWYINEVPLDYAEARVRMVFCGHNGFEIGRHVKIFKFSLNDNLTEEAAKHNIFMEFWLLNDLTVKCEVVLVPHDTQPVLVNEVLMNTNQNIESFAEVIDNQEGPTEIMNIQREDQALVLYNGILKEESAALFDMLNSAIKDKDSVELIITDMRMNSYNKS